MPTKRCFKCRHMKPLDAFYRHPMMGDGHLGKCKECTKADVTENRGKRADYYRKYDRRRLTEDPERRAYHAWHGEDWRRRNPEKKRAQALVHQAVRSGRVKKYACRDCDNVNVHGHHPDYAKPLEVIWLCPLHHRHEHMKGQNGKSVSQG